MSLASLVLSYKLLQTMVVGFRSSEHTIHYSKAAGVAKPLKSDDQKMFNGEHLEGRLYMDCSVKSNKTSWSMSASRSNACISQISLFSPLQILCQSVQIKIAH